VEIKTAGSNSKKHLRDFIQKCREDIHFFVEYGLNSPNDTWQQYTLYDMVQAAQFGLPPPLPRLPDEPKRARPGTGDIPASRQIAAKSGQGPGKTHASTKIGLWRGFRSYGKTVVTAPTMRQCQDVWLSEASKVLSKAHPYFQNIFDARAQKVEIAKDRRWAIYCITSTDDKKLQGFHDDGLTIICEEMSGIDRIIIEQFQGTLSNNDCMLIGIGNPNLRDCSFFDCFHRDRHEWQTYTLNAEDTAEYRPDIVDVKRNERLERQYGKDSDVYRVRVLGEFPSADPNCVISMEDLEPCTARSMVKCAQKDLSMRVIAIDFARFGSDETVIYRRSGNAIVEQAVMSHVEPADSVRRAFRMQMEAGWGDGDCVYVPDATGMGQGVMHMFYEAGKQVYEFHNGSKAYRADQYGNLITEAWFDMATKVKEQEVYLPNDNRLLQQLAGRMYKTTEKGQIKLESKDDFVRRLEETSPDRADACVMAFYSKIGAPGLAASKGHDSRRADIWS